MNLRGGGLAERYVQASSLKVFLLAAAGLTVLLSLLDFTDQLSSIGQHYRLGDAAAHVLFTVPSRLLALAPVAMLLGCLLGLGALAKHSELTALRGLGVSESRLVFYLLKLAAPVILILFLLAQYVVPPAERLALAHQAAAASPAGFWATDGAVYLNVRRLDARGMPAQVDIYSFDPDGSLASAVHAQHVDVNADGSWTLQAVTQRLVTNDAVQFQRLPALAWHSFVPASKLRQLILPPIAMPPTALIRQIHALRADHEAATQDDEVLWNEISIPVSLIAMILVAVPFALRPPRSQSTGLQIAIGGGIGIVFTLCQQIAGYAGELSGLSPAAAELLPPLVLMAVALVLFRRMRE